MSKAHLHCACVPTASVRGPGHPWQWVRVKLAATTGLLESGEPGGVSIAAKGRVTSWARYRATEPAGACWRQMVDEGLLAVAYRSDRAVTREDLARAASCAAWAERRDEISVIVTDRTSGALAAHASAEISVRVDASVETTQDAYLASLFVAMGQRRAGLGRRLLARIESRLRERGCTHLWTQTAGYDGYGFYRKVGYEQIFEQTAHFQSGDSHVGFQRALAEPLPDPLPEPEVYAQWTFTERTPTDAEQALIDDGFADHAREHGCALLEVPERIEVVAVRTDTQTETAADTVAAFASGLAYRLVEDGVSATAERTYSGHFVLTDLFVDVPFRRHGIGRELLCRIEAQVFALPGVERIYSWAPDPSSTESKERALALLLRAAGYTILGERLPSRSVLLEKAQATIAL